MRLFHCTRRSNLESIQTAGLDPQRATQKRKAVWAGASSKIAWAIVHVLTKARNRGCSIEDLVVIEVEVPRSQLTRHCRSVWYSYATVTPEQIVTVHDASEYGPSAE
jgi:hypothetical protein